jgi:AcrR family transcriptional regulator
MNAAAQPTPRQRQAEETRRRLFAVACRLFSERGYHEVNVAEITREAGVAKGTFFAHFGTKDAVITELVEGQVAAARQARREALAAGTPVDALIAAAMTLGEEAGRSRSLSRAVLAATLGSRQVGTTADALFETVFTEMLADARAAGTHGLLDARRDPETLAHTLMASYLGAAVHFTNSPTAGPLVEILARLVEANLSAFVKEEIHDKARRRVRAHVRRLRRQ